LAAWLWLCLRSRVLSSRDITDTSLSSFADGSSATFFVISSRRAFPSRNLESPGCAVRQPLARVTVPLDKSSSRARNLQNLPIWSHASMNKQNKTKKKTSTPEPVLSAYIIFYQTNKIRGKKGGIPAAGDFRIACWTWLVPDIFRPARLAPGIARTAWEISSKSLRCH